MNENIAVTISFLSLIGLLLNFIMAAHEMREGTGIYPTNKRIRSFFLVVPFLPLLYYICKFANKFVKEGDYR